MNIESMKIKGLNIQRKSLLLLLLLLIYQIHTQAQEEIIGLFSSEKDTVEILFIGSSYFNYNNLPDLFKNLAESSGKKVYIDKFIPSGLYLSDHAGNNTTQGKIDSRDWDYVVLQGVGTVTAYPDSFMTHPLYPSLVTLQNKIYTNCSSSKMLFCLPWAFEDGMLWCGWPDDYEDMQLKIYYRTLQYSKSLDFMIAPVGWAWYEVLDYLNYPLHFLHLPDWNHPSLKGSYLMACVIYSAIFQESSEGNSYYGGLNAMLAENFQKVGSDIVLDSLGLWNISTQTYINEYPETKNFTVCQNYPNPFSNYTQIDFKLNKRSFVELLVIDVNGEVCCKLVNTYKSPGKHSIRFYGNDLPEGIYYYTLRVADNFQTRKMIHINN